MIAQYTLCSPPALVNLFLSRTRSSPKHPILQSRQTLSSPTLPHPPPFHFVISICHRFLLSDRICLSKSRRYVCLFVCNCFLQKKGELENSSVPAASIEEALHQFCKGVSACGSFWDHVLGYWKASLEWPERVLFLKYEDMKMDPFFHLKRLARSPLEEDLNHAYYNNNKTSSYSRSSPI